MLRLGLVLLVPQIVGDVLLVPRGVDDGSAITVGLVGEEASRGEEKGGRSPVWSGPVVPLLSRLALVTIVRGSGRNPLEVGIGDDFWVGVGQQSSRGWSC